MYKVKLLPITRVDLQKAKKWYNEQRAELGEEFKQEVNKEIDRIGTYPLHYQTKYKEIRVSYVTRFPYGIFYFIEEDKKQIIIIGVLHTKRNPNIIQKRVQKQR
ncbi:type II toxin-antitoxin system RelE/ParE family toxin [Pedobacter sp. BS3]|uniref:type II toxin-antitoxin system RelE/ParE family toxin n=1 Tax=Pedobacter sp. BS3 TaxID=2567937 RepID=UPI0011ED3191|nr:type II toxin-antitoxin system RelE/ParE family toxin [Pedobacter sp. BS3]TZF84869.1 type II toxin-antitoxin system RelE/ParE family toxin [Pedobacter sp. BS3]